MAWSGSAIFQEWVKGVMNKSGTGWGGLTADTLNVSLHNNTITPDKTAAVASTGFNTGVWTTTNEVTDATNWASGGRPLGSVTSTSAAGTYTFDAADLAGGGTLTLSGATGCLVYDNTITGGTVAKQGICFNYFGGAQSVTSGTFTIVWNASGIATVAV